MRVSDAMIRASLLLGVLTLATAVGCSSAEGGETNPTSRVDAATGESAASDAFDDDGHEHEGTHDASVDDVSVDVSDALLVDAPRDASDGATTAKLASVTFVAAGGSKLKGVLHLYNEGGGRGDLTITGQLEGLSPGKHGIHVHENGSCDHAGGHTSAGGHYDVGGAPHACPPTVARHRGDLGNVTATADGKVDTTITGLNLRLEELVGRAIVIHEKADDCSTQPSGNSGARIGCARIEARTP